MNSGSCGVRYQMSIAHGHRNTFMPHQSLNAVYIFAITRQPTCEGMPKTMEYNSPCSVIRLDTVIEPNRICKSLKCVRKISTSCTALNRWENHIHRWNYLSSIMTFFKNFQRSIVQWYFAARLAVCFIAHREHGIRQIHVRPFKALKLPKPQSGIQRENNTVMQVLVRQFLGCIYQGFCLVGSQKTLTSICDRGNLDANSRVLTFENDCSLQLHKTGLSKGIADNTAILLYRGWSRSSRDQAINNSLNIFPHDGRKGLHADSWFNNLVEALLVSQPAPLGSFGFRHIKSFKEVLEGHTGGALFGGFLFSGGSFGDNFLPHFRKTLRSTTDFSVFFEFVQYVMGFFCVPLFGRPSHAFFDSATVFFIADGVITIWLPVTLFTGRVLVVTHSRILSFDFKFFHAPTMPPLLGEDKGYPGNITMLYHIEITIPRKLRELLNQIQGLVKVPSWEFESPLRHHKKASGLTEQSVGPFLLRGILLVLGQKNLVASIESK